ncbi:MAG TPA: hypothetical protein PLN02_10290 [Azonexus sp.]|nr:hypothetical protein [Azonexus sp.]
MENKIPLPTDSIYKFYALFGLLVFVFCVGATIYISRSTNDLIFTSSIEYETLKTIEKPTTVEVAKREGIEKRVEVALADKTFFLRALGVIAALGMLTMAYGFLKWHREIQPIQDETARLQLAKLRHEVRALSENNSPE